MHIKRPLMVFCVLIVLLCILQYHFYPILFKPKEITGERVLQGRIDAWENRNGQTILYLSNIFFYGDSAEKITTNNSIGLRCYVDGEDSFKLGQQVAVQGYLSLQETSSNEGAFDTKLYYESRGYDYVMYDGKVLERGNRYDVVLQGLEDIRQYARQQLETYLSAEDAGILSAMLLGDKSHMKAETKALYRSVGISHILSISGLHISMIGGIFYKILKRLGCKGKCAVSISLTVIILYGIMIGMPPSAFRAIVMFGFGLAAPLFCRSHDRFTSLAVAAACLALWEPALMLDAGVQLSFMAVLGIIALYPTFLGIHQHHMKFADGLWVSFAITYMTVPVIMQTYYEVPLYSLLVNVCIIPFVPVLLGLGLGIVAFGGWWSMPAEIAGFLVRNILFFYERLIQIIAMLPGNTYVTGAPGVKRIVLFYIVLTGLIWSVLKIKRKLLIRSLISENAYMEGRVREYVKEQRSIKKYMRKVRIIQIAVMMFLMIVLLMRNNINYRVTVLDVGQGDCICIEVGRDVYMIDGGSMSEDRVGEYVILPFLKYRGAKKVEGWFLTHPDNDHTSGFVELCQTDKIEVETLYIPKVLETEFDEIYRLARSKGMNVVLLSEGDCMELAGSKWNVISPGDEMSNYDTNASSLVLLVECGEWKGLFMGDGGENAEQLVMAAGIDGVDMLKVGHHGSAVNANSEEFLGYIKPRIAVISCGRNNAYGHPHTLTLERLHSTGCRVWITAEDGRYTVGE